MGPYQVIKLPDKGDVTETHRLWRDPRSTQRIGSGVLIGEHFYFVNEPGTVQCVEAS